MSLRNNLLETIKSAYPDICPLQALLDLCHNMGYKESNGERQLRRLVEGKAVEVIKNDKKYITGYVWLNDIVSDKFTQKSVKFNEIGSKMDNQPLKSQNRLFQPPPIYN